MVGEQIRYPEGHFCEQAMSRMETVVVTDLAEDEFPAPSVASLKASDDIGLTSVVAAPLVARGELLGVMSLALSMLTDREDRHYGADDRDFLGAIASRIAIAIDNAMLFEEERRTALAFQTSLLPQAPPVLDGLEVAYKYVPAKPLETHGQGIQTQVGGDWYDIIRCPRAGWASSSAMWKAGAPGRPPSWASSGPRCARSPRTTSRPRRSCAGSTTGAGCWRPRRTRPARRAPTRRSSAVPILSTTPGRASYPSPTPAMMPRC